MDCVSIFADDVLVMDGVDAYEFYFMLGYGNEMRMIGVEPEEFIDGEYRKATALQSEDDLQQKMLEYLLNSCPKFKAEYMV